MGIGAIGLTQALTLLKSCDYSFIARNNPEVKILLPPPELRHRDKIASCRLLVVPSRGSWCLLKPQQMEMYRQIQKGATLGELLGEQFDCTGRWRWLAELYRRGMVSVNGRVAEAPPAPPVPPKEPTFIALHMAEGCNLRCAYCYNAAAQGETLSAPAALELLEKACRELESSEISVDFLGGEPLLAWSAITAILEGARRLQDRYGKHFRFMMQTNGMLLSQEVVSTLVKRKVGVGISLDGPAWLHDRQRRTAQDEPSHRRVVENMLRARDLGLDVNPLAVVTHPDRLVEMLDYFVLDLGLRSLRFNNLSCLGRARGNFKEIPSATEYSRGFLAMAERALELARFLNERLAIRSLGNYLHELVSDERHLMCRRSPCGLGEYIIAYGPDGWLYACEEYEEKTKEQLRLGRLSEVNLGKLRTTSPFWKEYRQRTVENVPRCSRCTWRKFCGGGCSQRALAAHGTWYREDPMCVYYERVFPGLMWRIGEDSDYLKYLVVSE